ncbi:MAG: helix-turn-helix transcriptional regulator [Acidobacteriota bacterium]|nr:helix-turn-helix transcriptional regulator [Acidobacteriota bacterium]
MQTSLFAGLGPALRWLRERQGKKQYHVADSAGITKGMLSAYETERQRPSLETLEKILGTLGCDLIDLHNALQIVNGRPEAICRPANGLANRGEESYPLRPPAGRATGANGASGANDEIAEGSDDGRRDLDRILGAWGPLPAAEERALTMMLEGFHQLLRYFHDSLSDRGPAEDAAPKSSEP